MSHEPSLKRRLGAALTSLATTAALVIPLAVPAAADHTDAEELVVVDGDGAVNEEGTTHTFLVEARDDAGDPVTSEDITILFEVESGPNVGDTGTCTTDSDGSDPQTEEGQAACDLVDTDDDEFDTDTVRFWIDEDGGTADEFDEGEINVLATKTWHGPAAAIAIEPDAADDDSAAVGTCNDYTVTVTDAEGNPVPGEVIRIIRDADETLTDEATETVEDELTFCTPSTDGNDVATTEDPVTNEGSDEGETDAGTDQTGQLTLGIASEITGDEALRVYIDADADGDFDDGTELTATSTKTWTAGGADAVTTVDAEPESAINFISETHTITVTLTNEAGDPVPGVKVEMEVTDGPSDGLDEGDAGVTGDPADFTSDNDGQVSFFYSSDTIGEDTILFWVDQTGGTADVHDTDEPSDEVNKTWAFPGETERLEGVDRHLTAVDISQDLFPTDESATNVVLARSTDYPDALAGTPLAVHLGAPMLLTPDPLSTAPAWVLHPDTEDEIDRLLTPGTDDTVYILGGDAAVGTDVELRLRAKGYDVVRLDGRNRWETAVEIANEITGGDTPASIHITTGTNFPDALTAGAAAVETDGVIVLSAGDDRWDATTAYLTEHADTTRYAIGGPAARAYDVFVEDDNELVGTGRYETAMIVVERFWPDAHPQVGIARADTVNGEGKFADALSGGTHIGHHGGPLVLTEPDRLLDEDDGTWDDQSPEAYLEMHAETIEVAFLYGGNAAIHESTENEIRDAIRGIA